MALECTLGSLLDRALEHGVLSLQDAQREDLRPGVLGEKGVGGGEAGIRILEKKGDAFSKEPEGRT